MTPQDTARVTRLINRFDEAAREMAFKGSYHPEDQEEIEADYNRARERLQEALETRTRNFDLACVGDIKEAVAFNAWYNGEFGEDGGRFEGHRQDAIKSWEAAINYVRRRAAGKSDSSTYPE